jgi:hypothetical protein
MTRLFIDAREVPFPPGVNCSLDQILRHVELTELPPDSAIRQVHIDGAAVLEESTASSGLDQRERIEVFTASLGDIARESISEANSYLDRVQTVIPALSKSFQDLPGTEAFENLRQLCDGFYWLNLLLDRLGKTFHRPQQETLVQGLSISKQNQRLLTIFRELVEAQERRDFLLISDLLEYEIMPFLPVWKEMLAAIGTDSVSS